MPAEKTLQELKDFASKIKKGARKGGPYYNMGLSVPASCDFSDMEKALRPKEIKEKVSQITGLSTDTLNELMTEAMAPKRKNARVARMAISLAVRVATKEDQELSKYFEKQHILSGTRIHPLITYLYHNGIMDTDSIHSHMDKALWYLKPLTFQAQQNHRKAAQKIFGVLTGDEELAKRLAEHITFDNEAQSHEFLRLVSHSFHKPEEARKLDTARAIFLANHKPMIGILNALYAPTSIMSAPHVNYLSAHHAILPLLMGLGYIGSYPSITFNTTPLNSMGVAKIDAVLQLAKYALDEKREVPKIYQDAVNILRGFASNLRKGVTVNNKKYTVENLDPIRLASAFMVAQHKIEDVMKVWSAAEHLGHRIYNVHAIIDTVHHSLYPHLAGENKEGQPLSDDEKNKRAAAQKILTHTIEAANKYIQTGDIRQLEEISKALSSHSKLLPQQDKVLERHGIESRIQTLKTLDKVEKLPQRSAKQIEERLDEETRQHGYIPGVMGLGPKIGIYAASLLGNTRHYIIDTWMNRLSTTYLSPKTDAPKTLRDFRIVERPTLGYIEHEQHAQKEIKSVLKALDSARSRRNKPGVVEHLQQQIRTSLEKHGLPKDIDLSIIGSRAQNQAWVWHQIRNSIETDAPPHTSSLHGFSEFIANHQGDWHKQTDVTGKGMGYYPKAQSLISVTRGVSPFISEKVVSGTV